jgi:xylulokinase
LNRLGFGDHPRVKLVAANAEAVDEWWDGVAFDRILLDAPCSATGVIRRHPEIKWLRSPEQVEEAVKLQAALLGRLWPLLKPGGILLYATCSVLRAENNQQIQHFVEHHPDAESVEINATWGQKLEHGRDWINLRLTGELATEAGDESGTGYFDPAARRYDAAACAAIDPRLERSLPRLVAPSEPLGRLTPDAARALGLAPGTLVAPGGGDNMCAAIGSGATHAGVAVLSLGTSATVFARSETPVIAPDGLIAPFCDSAGAWLPLLCVMNATGVLHEVARAFGQELDALTDAAARVAPGADGLLFVPYLQGERVPDLPGATGALLGLRPGLLEPARVFRAALEGVALNLAWGVARMRALGLAVDGVRLVGGGARNALWASILADALAAPVRRLAEPESAALGAALQSAWIAEGGELDARVQSFVAYDGEALEPDPARAQQAREQLERFVGVVGRLYPPA